MSAVDKWDPSSSSQAGSEPVVRGRAAGLERDENCVTGIFRPCRGGGLGTPAREKLRHWASGELRFWGSGSKRL